MENAERQGGRLIDQTQMQMKDVKNGYMNDKSWILILSMAFKDSNSILAH